MAGEDGHGNPTEDISLGAVYRAIGTLEGTVSGMGREISELKKSVEDTKRLVREKGCFKETEILNLAAAVDSNRVSIGEISRVEDQVKGGWGVLKVLAAVLVTVLTLGCMIIGTSIATAKFMNGEKTVKENTE